MVSYASHMDHVDSAFRELTRLSNEFYIIPRSEFPFRCFKHHEIWNEFGISPKESFFDFKRLGSTKGNYLAAHILRGLRTGSVKPIRVRDHNLARLLDLPYDIILEIIGHLHPIDLYSLIRTAKPLRNILLSRRSLSVWALVFANHEDIPPIPRGNSPPRWVTTLFAPPRCDSCGIYPAMVHYTFCERRCTRCAQEQYISEEAAEAIMGPATMVKLVSLRKFLRYTHTTHPHAPPYDTWHVIPKAPVYRIQDMHDFESQLCRIQQKIEQPTPDAQQRMDEFLLVRAQEIEDEKLIARRSENWSRSFYNTQHYYSLRLYKEIADSWSRRLTKLGFNPRIVSASFHAIHNVVKSNRVTKSNKKSFLKFEQEIMNAIFFGKHNHLQIQRSQRQKAVLEFYCEEIIRAYPPSLCDSLPSRSSFIAFPYVQRFIDWGTPETLAYTDTSELVVAIYTLVHRWLVNSEALLLQAWHLAGYGIGEFDVRPTASIAAMSVFICPYHDHTALVGWEAVASHIVCSLDSSASWSHGSSILEFSVAGHEVVRSLSTSIGKDWCSASIVELDAAAHIFICTDCPMITCGDDHGSYFFTWRQAVEHGAISSPTHRNFVPVSDETRRYILARKKPLMDPMQTAWACNHCPRHFHDLVPVRRANVIRHLARAHGIKGPRFKNDWVYMGSWSPGDPVFLSRDPSRCFICMMCPPGRHYKMYREQSLKMHLSAKHGVSDPIQNMHWKVLDIPSQSAALPIDNPNTALVCAYSNL